MTETWGEYPREILPSTQWSVPDFFALDDSAITRLPDSVAVSAIITARRMIARAQAIQMRAIHRLNVLRAKARSVADELAPELRLTRHSTQTQIALAGALSTRLSGVLAAMDVGDVDAMTARKVFDVTAPLSDELAREVDAKISARLTEKDPVAVRRMARTAVQAVDPQGYAERAAQRRRDRKVELIHDDDAMATLSAYLPAEVASAAYHRIDGIARKLKTKEETRTLEQLRADVFGDLLVGKMDATGAGVAAQVFVHVPVGAALGITDRGCELAGHGPIPGNIAREIMHRPNSVWRKVVTDPVSSVVRDVGRTRYKPPAALDDLVKARDRECRMPGCYRPAQRCDIDHHDDWAKGGTTSEDNLGCLCERHHYLKDEPGWDFSFNPKTAEMRVTTPTGRVHIAKPEPIVDATQDSDPPPF